MINSILKIDDINGNRFRNITMIGVKVGHDKIQHVINEVIKEMSTDAYVGIISSEISAEEIQKRFLESLSLQGESEITLASLDNAKLIIHQAVSTMNDEYVINEMRAMNYEMKGLDFLAIDKLNFDTNFYDLVEILSNINKEAIKMNTKVLIIFQLNENNQLGSIK